MTHTYDIGLDVHKKTICVLAALREGKIALTLHTPSNLSGRDARAPLSLYLNQLIFTNKVSSTFHRY